MKKRIIYNDLYTSMNTEGYNIEDFRQRGYQIIDTLVEYLRTSSKETRNVLDLNKPEEEYSFWKDYEVTDLESFNQELIKRSISLHHPKYIGHQVSAPLPDLALLGLTSDLLNNGMGIYEMGAAATAIERYVIDQFTAAVGYDHLSSGFLTSGGTLANLTALLAARSHAISKYETHQDKLYIVVSEQAHFCVERAVITMGIPKENILKIGTNNSFQIDIKQTISTCESIVSKGGFIMSIVACACSTATGTYDDISALSDYCQKEGIWLHVDGAHGGAAMFSDRLKSKLLNGIQRADSFIVDAHKMMLTPALCTAVLFKNGDNSYISFKQKADYLFDLNENDPHNLAKRTYETTKLMMGIKVYYLLKKYGKKYIGEYIERQTDLTYRLSEFIQLSSDLEVAHHPMSNILCFRFINDKNSNEELNLLNQEIRSILLESGKFYIVSTMLRGNFYLRVTVMNALTQWADLIELIEEIRTIVHLKTNC